MKRSWFKYVVVAILILNAIASITVNYFTISLHPGTIRAALLLVFIAYIIFYDYPKQYISVFIFFSLLYYFFLTLFSAGFIYSFNLYLKFLMGLMMYPIGYRYINSLLDLKLLLKGLFFSLLILNVDFLISNLFDLGVSDYLEDSVLFGIAGVNITKSMVPIILTFPLYSFITTDNSQKKVFFLLLVLMSASLVFIGLKRTAISSLVLGYSLLLYFNPKSGPYKKYIVIVLFFVALLLPSLNDIFQERLDARQEQGSFDVEVISEKEGRVREIQQVLSAFEQGSIIYKFFGRDIFYDRQFFQQDRMLHIDYFIMLSGSGLVGLTLFVLIYFLILYDNIKYRIYIKHNHIVKLLTSLGIALVMVSLILSVAGSVYAILTRSIIFVLLGAIAGNLKTISLQQAAIKHDRNRFS